MEPPALTLEGARGLLKELRTHRGEDEEAAPRDLRPEGSAGGSARRGQAALHGHTSDALLPVCCGF